MRPYLYDENKNTIKLLNTFNFNSSIKDKADDTDILKCYRIDYATPYHNGIQYNFIIKPDDDMKKADITISAGTKFMASTFLDVPNNDPIINVRLNFKCESTPTFNIMGNYSVAIYEAPISSETGVAENYARSHSPITTSTTGPIAITASISGSNTAYAPLYQPYTMNSGKTVFSLVFLDLVFINRNDHT